MSNKKPKIANKPRKLNSNKISFVILLFVIGFVFFALNNQKWFPIKEIEVNASYQHVSPETLKTLIEPFIKHKSFFGLTAKSLGKQLINIPWIYQVSIRRTWPAKISIFIIEQQAVAKWNNKALFNADGQLFIPSANEIPDQLPSLFGADNEANVLWTNYQNMNNNLKTINLKIESIEDNLNFGWKLILDNGLTVIIGNKDIEERFALFIRSYPKILQIQKTPIESIDLRYANGFAIKPKNII